MLYFNRLQAFSSRLLHGVSQAQDGNFNEEKEGFESTLRQLAQRQALPRTPRYLKQEHEKTVVVATPQLGVPTGDAWITQETNLPLMVKTADCQGMIVYAPEVHALGIVHSGWRGSVQNIVGETITSMAHEYGADPSQMQVSISPSLGPCCAEFTDPQKELPEFCRPFIRDQKVDFWLLSLQQLQDAGVPGDQIEIAEHCTKCQPGYFSHRRGETGRFITWGMLL